MFLTREGSFGQALLDPIGASHVEGLGDFLVHEGLVVQDVGHHHAQVEHLQQLSDVRHLHQLLLSLVQLPRVQVSQHGPERPRLHRGVHVDHSHLPGAEGHGIIHHFLLDADERPTEGGEQPASSFASFQGSITGTSPKVGPVSFVYALANVKTGSPHQQLPSRKRRPRTLLFLHAVPRCAALSQEKVVELGGGGGQVDAVGINPLPLLQDQDDVCAQRVLQQPGRVFLNAAGGCRDCNDGRRWFGRKEGSLKERSLHIAQVGFPELQVAP